MSWTLGLSVPDRSVLLGCLVYAVVLTITNRGLIGAPRYRVLLGAIDSQLTYVRGERAVDRAGTDPATDARLESVETELASIPGDVAKRWRVPLMGTLTSSIPLTK